MSEGKFLSDDEFRNIKYSDRRMMARKLVLKILRNHDIKNAEYTILNDIIYQLEAAGYLRLEDTRGVEGYQEEIGIIKKTTLLKFKKRIENDLRLIEEALTKL